VVYYPPVTARSLTSGLFPRIPSQPCCFCPPKARRCRAKLPAPFRLVRSEEARLATSDLTAPRLTRAWVFSSCAVFTISFSSGLPSSLCCDVVCSSFVQRSHARIHIDHYAQCPPLFEDPCGTVARRAVCPTPERPPPLVIILLHFPTLLPPNPPFFVRFDHPFLLILTPQALKAAPQQWPPPLYDLCI